MAKLSQPWDADRIYGLKGVLDFYFWKGIPVVRKWPEIDPANLTQATKSQWPIFGYINQQWGATDLLVKQALSEMARGTQRLARDYQLELYYGKSITFGDA